MSIGSREEPELDEMEARREQIRGMGDEFRYTRFFVYWYLQSYSRLVTSLL